MTADRDELHLLRGLAVLVTLFAVFAIGSLVYVATKAVSDSRATTRQVRRAFVEEVSTLRDRLDQARGETAGVRADNADLAARFDALRMQLLGLGANPVVQPPPSTTTTTSPCPFNLPRVNGECPVG